jgi:hypothetical protein
VELDQFRILSGDDALSVYEFNTGMAKHYFCKYCGIHPFHRPRTAPEKWEVNVRCLENLDLAQVEILPFDGKNWEEAVKTFQYR